MVLALAVLGGLPLLPASGDEDGADPSATANTCLTQVADARVAATATCCPVAVGVVLWSGSGGTGEIAVSWWTRLIVEALGPRISGEAP